MSSVVGASAMQRHGFDNVQKVQLPDIQCSIGNISIEDLKPQMAKKGYAVRNII